MKYLLFVVALLCAAAVMGQQKDSTRWPSAPPPPDPSKPRVYNYVEQQPVPGFDVPSFLRENLHYPKAARKNDVQGRVIVKFIVKEDGSVSDVKTTTSIGGGCEEEAIRVVEKMPRWRPGKQNGTPVKVFFTLPIQFKLEDGPRKK